MVAHMKKYKIHLIIHALNYYSFAFVAGNDRLESNREHNMFSLGKILTIIVYECLSHLWVMKVLVVTIK